MNKTQTAWMWVFFLYIIFTHSSSAVCTWKQNQGLFTCCSLCIGRPRPRCSRNRRRGESAHARSAATALASECKCGTSARRTSSPTQSAGMRSSTPPHTFPAACTCASAAKLPSLPHNPGTETEHELFKLWITIVWTNLKIKTAWNLEKCKMKINFTIRLCV